MKTPQFLKLLWGKIEEKIKEQREAERHHAEDPQQPPPHVPSYDYGAARHHPVAHENQHRATEQYYWQKQLHLAEELNRLTDALNQITRWTTGFAGLAAFAGFASIFILWWTLVETMNNGRLDQRAWVGPSKFHVPKMVPDTDISFCVEITNSGKTPATRFKGVITGKLQSRGPVLTPDYAWDAITTPIDATSTLYPGVPLCLKTHPMKLSQSVVEFLQRGDGAYYVYGMVDYDDVFGASHCTMFCAVLKSDLIGFDACPTYNDITDTKCER